MYVLWAIESRCFATEAIKLSAHAAILEGLFGIFYYCFGCMAKFGTFSLGKRLEKYLKINCVNPNLIGFFA
jgi:hypothetical protein